MHDIDAVFGCELDNLLEEWQFDALRGRIRRKVDNQHSRLGKTRFYRVLELGEEIDVRSQWYVPDVGARDHRSVDMDRIARIGN